MLTDTEKTMVNTIAYAAASMDNKRRKFLTALGGLAGSITRGATKIACAPRMLDQEGIILNNIKNAYTEVLDEQETKEAKAREMVHIAQTGELCSQVSFETQAELIDALTKCGLSTKDALVAVGKIMEKVNDSNVSTVSPDKKAEVKTSGRQPELATA